MRRRAVPLILAAALCAAPLLAGCRGDEQPWLAHQDGAVNDADVPNLTPQNSAAPASATPAPGGPAAVDPGAPPPVTEAAPGAPGQSATDAPPPVADPATGDSEAAEPTPKPKQRKEQTPELTASKELRERQQRNAGPAPSTKAERVDADKQAMLDLRTMVSIIEGCRSGRDSYRLCDSHKDLGSPKVLGLEIGKQPGEIMISASPHGFRITTVSRSGTKFTMARGPAGDRFRCIPGPQPGACPASRTWGW